MQGTVTSWKGTFGFIGREGGKDVFVHFSDVISDERYRALAYGDQVGVDIGDGERVRSGKALLDLSGARAARMSSCIFRTSSRMSDTAPWPMAIRSSSTS